MGPRVYSEQMEKFWIPDLFDQKSLYTGFRFTNSRQLFAMQSTRELITDTVRATIYVDIPRYDLGWFVAIDGCDAADDNVS